MGKKIVILLALVMSLAACNTMSKFKVKNVTIDSEIVRSSRGYVRVVFTPSKDAYYVAGMMKVNDEYDPVNLPDHFMNLMLDSLYSSYLNWRYDYLKKRVPYVADFASHSLHYGVSDKFFVGLEADTDYWLYSFVVDPESNKPYGSLHLETVHTEKESHNHLHLEARVQGTYVYAYPLVEHGGAIDEEIPYTWDFEDSAIVVEHPHDDPVQSTIRYMEILFNTFKEYGLEDSITCVGVDSEDCAVWLEDGHTYYLMLAALDAGPVDRVIYRFRWNSDDKEIKLTEMFRQE